MVRNEDYHDEQDVDGSGQYDGAYDDAAAGDDVSEATGEDVARATGASDGRMVYAGAREGDGRWLTRSLAWALVLAGLAMFLFPEPASSLLGIGLIVAGLVVWVATSE
jgi:hypothetical protein